MIAVLLSLGRNPASGRARPAEREARAIAIARAAGRPVIGLHAGAAPEPLRPCLGMGLARLLVLEPGADPLVPLAAHLAAHPPAAILAGSRAEQGEGSGLLPYAIAARLGWPVLPGIVALAFDEAGPRAVQALPGGRRRVLTCEGPFLGLVDQQGPPVPQAARGPALRAGFEPAPSLHGAAPALLPPVIETLPARRRPRRLAPGQTAATGGQRLLAGASPREAARAILAFLEAERLLAPAREDTP